jgi:hypothetical protein
MNEETKNKNLDLVSFVDRVIEEKNFPKDLEKEVLDQIREDLLSKVEDRVNALIINNLPEDKLEEFNKMLDSDISDEEMQGFLSANIPNLAQLIASELIVFEQTYLS